MKIIDKNTDFYDYNQHIYKDDYFTFDRRDSFILTKKDFMDKIPLHNHWWKGKHFLLLQINHTFWLAEIKSTYDNYRYTDYTLEFVYSWENYNSNRELIKLSIIEFGYGANKDNYIECINNNHNYRERYVFNKWRIYKENKDNRPVYEERHIPILREIGVTTFIDGADIYNALEEYFSEGKTLNERTEPIGATNNDKITAHGFNLVSSFRKK